MILINDFTLKLSLKEKIGRSSRNMVLPFFILNQSTFFFRFPEISPNFYNQCVYSASLNYMKQVKLSVCALLLLFFKFQNLHKLKNSLHQRDMYRHDLNLSEKEENIPVPPFNSFSNPQSYLANW